KIYHIENPVRRKANGDCPAPAYVNDPGLCVMPGTVNNAFTYIEREDRSLDFGLSFWFGGGAHCGIIGNAKYTGEGWRYEHNMDAEDPRRRCAVNITAKNEFIIFDADPQATCRMECGAQAQLRGVMIPFDAVETRNV